MRMKRLLTFLTLLTVFIGVGWAATSTVTAEKITSSSVSWTGTGSETWSVTVNGGATNQNVTNGYAQIGSRNSPSTSVTFSTSGISGTITSIVVDCASYNGLGTVSTTVGGNAFGAQNQSIPTWSNNTGGDVTFTGSASGTIVITMTNGTSGQRAMYIKSITVTYGSSSQTFSISYGNPSNGTISGPTSAVAGSEVSLSAEADPGYQFGSWNVKDASNNTVTVTDNKFTMPTSNVTVNANFTALPTYSITVTGGTASPTSAYEGQTVTLTPTIPSGKVLDWDNTVVTPSTLEINHSDYTFTMPGEAVSVAFAFKDAPIGQTATYIFNTVEGIEALGLTAPSSGGTNLSEDDTYDSGDVSMTTTFGSTNTRIWYNSSTGYDLRIYGSSNNHPQAGTLTFTVPSGYVITQMDFTYNTVNGFTVNTGEFNSDYSTWTGSAQSVTLTSTYGQNQIKTITIYYSSTSVQTTDLYIVGQVNGLSGWSATKAVKMTYDGTKYAAKFYVTGNTTNEMGVNAGTFVFATKIGSWDDVNGNRYEPPFADEEGGDKNWWLATSGATNSGSLYKKNYNNSFLIPAGLYEIEVDKNISSFNLKTIKDLTPTIDPEGGEVVLNTTVTASISENFNTFISSCNAFEGTDNNVSVVTPEVKFYVNNEEEATLSKEVTLDAVGETTVTGKCALVSGNTEYTYKTKSETYDVYQPYTVTIAGGITGGTVSASPRNNVREGTTVRVFPTPSTNYELTSLTYTVEGNSTAVDITMTGDEYSFAMPAGNVTINATFTYNGPVATSMTFSRITSTDDLVAGEKYLIVNEDAGKALQFNGSSSTASDITITNNQTTILETDAAVLTLGESNGVYTFATGSGYVANTSSTNIVLGESSDNWTVTFSGDNAVIHHTLVSTDRYVRYINNNFKAYASNNNYNNSSPVQLYKETTASLKAPTISPEGGTFLTSETPSVTVSITCATADASIYYSTDGENFNEYTEPITVTSTTTVYAYSSKDNENSETVSETYNFTDVLIDPVVFSPIAGTYSGAQTLEMYSVNQNAKIYYTTDGSTPSATNGTLYGGAIPLEVGNTYNFKAIAVVGNNCSAITEGTYVINTASSSGLNSIAELNSADEDESRTLANPFQIIYMNTWRHDGYTPEYAYVRDNSGYGLIYFRNDYYHYTSNGVVHDNPNAVQNALICEMGDWLPGGIATGTVKIWSDGFHNELGGSSYKETITSWPTSTSQLSGNTPIIPEEMTNANINAGWQVSQEFAAQFQAAYDAYIESLNLEDGEEPTSQQVNAANAAAIAAVGGYSQLIQPDNVWGHYVHLRKNTIKVTNATNNPNATPDGTGELQRHKYTGFITDQSGVPLTYYDGFYNFSGYNGTPDYSNDYFQNIQNNGGTFDVYGVVAFYGPYASNPDFNFTPFEVFPIDFLYIYKPIINIDNVAYSDHDPITEYETKEVTLTCATEGATIWYKTDDMEDYAEYTGPITVDHTTTIETYSSIPTKYNDVMESVTNTLTINIGNIDVPVISPASGVFTIGEDDPVDATITCATSGATIYFTIDGSDPKTSSTRYEYTADNIAEYLTDIDETTTVRAIAFINDTQAQREYYSAEAEARTYTFVKTNGIIYTLVTDQTQLNESSVYVIVNKANHMAVSTTQNENNRGATGVKFVDETTKDKVEGNGDVALFMLTKVGNKWYVKTNNSDQNGYLYVGNGNTLLTSATAYESAEATINIDADTEHQAHISFVYDNELTRYLRYYNNGKAFSTYTSETSNLPVSLYYLEATPLANIEKEGKLNGQYTVADQLVAVYADVDKGILWCKDQGDASIDKTYPKGSQIDYLKNDANAQNGRDWDQSNWVALQFTAPSGSNHPVTTLLTGVEGKLIKQATIQGIYTNNINFTITMAEDKLEFVEGQTAPYTKNEYCTANFLPENLNLTEQSTGAVNYGDDNKYFFMNPKIQEVCHITYAEWNKDKECFTVPSTSGFSGAFTVDLTYNVQPNVNLSTYLTDGDIYQFKAIVQRTSISAYGPKDIEHNTDPNGAFKVYPLDLTSDSNIPTAINTVSVGNGEVKSVKYVNVAGIVSDVPFQGVNIVVTEYTDGTRTTTKMLKK